MSGSVGTGADQGTGFARPAYDREGHGNGIVHIGLGAFHRAHQAVYTDDALALAGGDWMITAVSLRSTGQVDALNAQNGVFTLIERHADGPRARQIGAITHALAASREAGAVLASLADPETRIVTITVTEKAYGIDRASGRVMASHPAIAHDLADPSHPVGLVGFIVAALARRHAAGIEPFSVLSCDNLPSNGKLLRAGVIDFAQQIDPVLADWIGAHVAFPSSMVDRITPAATQKTYDDAHLITGARDACAIETEPFTQWVIEDHFPTGRPAWDLAGAIMTDDVEPFELMKLRMLNGAHSLIAYLGQLGGYRYVRDAMADPVFAALVARHMQNAAASMEPIAGLDFADYGQRLLARFRNPEIAHETRQIAMDGTEKLPQRIFAPMQDIDRRGGLAGPETGSFALCMAAWACVMAKRVNALSDGNAVGVPLSGEDAVGALGDPRAVDIIAALGKTGAGDGPAQWTPAEIYDRLAGLAGWLPGPLAASVMWRDAVIERIARLKQGGVAQAMAQEIGA